MGLKRFKADDEPTSTGASAQRRRSAQRTRTTLRAAGIPVLEGRAFTASDNLGAPLVAIVNRSLAKQLFGDHDPIGRRIAWTAAPAMIHSARRRIGAPSSELSATRATQDSSATRRRRSSSRSRRAESSRRRCSCERRPIPRALQHSIVQYIHDAAPHQIIDNVSTLEEIRDATVVPRRLNAMFVASFAALAFLIAIVGIAGVLASSVRSRTAELGIRMSLGAGPERLRRMVLAEGGVLIGLGIAIGFGGSVFTARLLRGLLFEVAPHDPTTFAVAALLLAGVGILACAGPAARAATVDPATALRAD